MSNTGDDAVLSDVEDETPVPIELPSTSPHDDKFQQLLSDLDRERQSRQALEASKSDLQTSFNRLKLLAHESIKKRDESNRLKDEALKANDQLKIELNELVRHKDEVFKEFNEKCDEAIRSKESLKSEVESAAEMLLNGIEAISEKVSGFKEFRVGGLPRSNKHTGLGGVAYGVIKRMNEIVEEMIRQVELRGKERDEARELMEQRNFESVIEVSKLEARIDGLKKEVLEKSGVVEDFEKLLSEKDGRLGLAEKELEELRMWVSESEDKLKNLEMKMELQRPLLVDQLSYVAKIHDQIDSIIKIVNVDRLDHLELSESLFMPKETDVEENLRASLAGMVSIYGLSRIVVEKTKELVEERSNEVKRLNETVSELVKEKEHIGTLLRSALWKRLSVDLSSKTNELFKVAENGLREAGIDYKFSNHPADGKEVGLNDEAGAVVAEDDEIYTLAGALENIIKQSQLEIIELKHTVEVLRVKHMDAAVRVLRYLKCTKGHGLFFPVNNDLQLKVYSDSDWAGDPNDRRSVGAYCLLLGPVAISWRSKKQNVTSKSSAEAEYRALSDASCEVIWIVNLLQALQLPISGPTAMFCDSKAAIDLTANPVYHARTKHIELDVHFIREKINSGLVSVSQISTKENVADILTKSLGKVLHWTFSRKLGLCLSPKTSICGGTNVSLSSVHADVHAVAKDVSHQGEAKDVNIPKKLLAAFS